MKRPILSRKLVLEARVRTPDGSGGQTATWVALGTLWAVIEARSGRSAGGPAEARSRMGLKITCRAAPQGSPARPRPGQRLREGDRLYTVLGTAASPVSANYLTITAVEEVVR